jgi:ubiquinone/menaquinone biosynthesis C-methylase UbiE
MESYVPVDKLSLGNFYIPGTINMDITSINFPDSKFDVIICNHVLEHIENDKLAMKELFRVLKPGGWAVLLVPIDKNRTITYEDHTIVNPKQREKIFGQYDHVRIYGIDYKDRLSSAGFKVEIQDYVSKFSEEDIFKYGFQRGEDIFICYKF